MWLLGGTRVQISTEQFRLFNFYFFMRKIIFILICLLGSFVAQAQNEGTMIVRMMETDAEDLKCEIYPLPNHWREARNIKEKIQELMNNGRYIQSITPTKFGFVVVHKLNKNSIDQIMGYFYDTKAKDLFKQGYSFKFESKTFDYPTISIAIYEKNPKITIQKTIKWDRTNEKKSNKKLSKMNAKGLYVKFSNFEAIVQNGHDDIVEQCYKYVEGEQNFIDIVEKKKNEGWMLGSVNTYLGLNYYFDRTYNDYYVIFDKPRDGNMKRECVATINTQESLVDFLQQKVAPGYNIDMTWGGWNGKTKETLRTEKEQWLANHSNDMNIIDVLSGLVGKVTEIVDYSKGGTGSVGSADTNESGGNSYSSSSSSTSSSSGKKCQTCNGTGNCSPKSASGRKNACSGSGLCGYCSGTGWIKAGGGEAACKACNGTKKCKTCKGSGKCPSCGGSGKR